MINVTYLFGAGASCDCLPTYSNFRTRFSMFSDFIQKMAKDVGGGKIELIAELKELANIVQEIHLEFKFHSTPDTIAKKYYHAFDGVIKLRQLKEIVMLFFLYEQTMYISAEDAEKKNAKQTVDKRYDAFIATILRPEQGAINFVPNINVLTWNYDLQFEIAFMQYKQCNVYSAQDEIQSYPRIIDKGSNFNSNKFSIIHLNGIAYGNPNKYKKDNIGNVLKSDIDRINYLLDVYVSEQHSQNRGGEKLLKFAWENMNSDFSIRNNILINNAITAVERTNVLVINGYSFPNFNRNIDSRIIRNMGYLEKVYIQSPDASDIEKKISNILARKVETESVGYWNQFFVPDWDRNPLIKRPYMY